MFGVGVGVGVLEGDVVGLLVNTVENEVAAFDDIGCEEWLVVMVVGRLVKEAEVTMDGGVVSLLESAADKEVMAFDEVGCEE